MFDACDQRGDSKPPLLLPTAIYRMNYLALVDRKRGESESRRSNLVVVSVMIGVPTNGIRNEGQSSLVVIHRVSSPPTRSALLLWRKRDRTAKKEKL
jgi:hypothetical protein